MIRAVVLRLVRALRWLVPSLVAACAGGATAGLVEGLGGMSIGTSLVAAGFVVIVLVPVLAVLLSGGRIVLAAWQPRDLAATIVESDGSMPRLAGWLATAGLGLVILGWTMWRATWFFSRHATFHVTVVAFLYPLVMIAMVLLLVGISVPTAQVCTHVARALDRRWRARGHRSALTPRTMLAAIAGVLLLGGWLAWRLIIRPRVGPLDLSPLDAPFAGVVVAVLVATAWPRLAHVRRARTAVASAILLCGILLGAGAVLVPLVRPELVLEIWGEKPIAGLAIETAYDLETIRAHISLAQYRPVARPGAAHPDIILITIDTVRADHTPPYGGVAAMPNLAELAKHGTVFEWAFSPSNVTRRSIPSLITGLSADRVHGRVVGWALRLDPRHVVLAERMTAGGYETAGFMCCDGFWGARGHTGLERGLNHVELEHDGAALATLGSLWLSAREATHPTKPLFVWMHILEPHNWAEAGPEPSDPGDRSRLYDRALATTDPMIATLLAPFAARPPDQQPIVIITADHGEALGDHGQPYHSTDLYNSQTHVPLVIAGPGIPVQRVGETISLTGLTPTILELAGFDATDKHMDGIAFADLATGRRASTEDGVAFAAMIKDRSNPGGTTAYVKGHWKLVITQGREELYDIASDPNETSNRVEFYPEVVAKLRAELAARNAAARASPFE